MINKDTYKRLTYRYNKGIDYIDNDFNGVYYSDCINGDSGCITKIYKRLVELEDKIENGTLIARYFLSIDNMPNGMTWYNVCSVDSGSCIIEYQCVTLDQAEAKLKELQEKEMKDKEMIEEIKFKE